MYLFREQKYGLEIPRNSTCILGADIGGTNCNFGFFVVRDKKPILLFSRHTKSKLIGTFVGVLQQLLAEVKHEYQITVSHVCFAVAGIVSGDYCKPTNLPFAIDLKEIRTQTTIPHLYLTNDFTVIWHGIDCIKPTDLITIKQGVPSDKANKVIIGAGTGLGKAILGWDDCTNNYMPIASEGGHADFAINNQLEFDLCTFIKQHKTNGHPVSWEDVLSGDGIQRIYAFFRARNNHLPAAEELVKNGLHPDEIFQNKDKDEHSKQTCNLYAYFYARFAKNSVLDALALGGVYIAGGIAARNVPLFLQDYFLHEFLNCEKQQAVLHQTPIYLIADYNISLFGAARYIQLMI
ncbi:MAG TPA: glucokinase [Candidatus Babeliales bacterium]|nr:glucokinase [Candidatus Babeliales bacterium]